MITIDGSIGEGGGQILRTALSLSLVTGRAFRIERIRERRARPGLLRQHLACVRAAESLGATVEGAELGSSSLGFRPGVIRPGAHHFAVGSAGSACLVLQTVLPPLMLAGQASSIRIEGGTHNPHAPPFEFLERVFLPCVRRMGPRVEARLERVGFFPKGGGRIAVEIEPVRRLVPLELVRRGPITRRMATALVAQLPISIARRELGVVRDRLGFEEAELRIREERDSAGPGNVLLLAVEWEGGSEIVSGFGERGVAAEVVADRAIEELRRFLAVDVPVDPWLADQLMVPFALAGGGRFRTLPLSGHGRTNLEVVRRFLGVALETSEDPASGTVEVRFGPT